MKKMDSFATVKEVVNAEEGLKGKMGVGSPLNVRMYESKEELIKQ
ncbi:MAG TPA: hypothetical protein VK125_01860 [Bacillota bacterium]|nr:hypothetical protein [Bacillota bacterium]